MSAHGPPSWVAAKLDVVADWLVRFDGTSWRSESLSAALDGPTHADPVYVINQTLSLMGPQQFLVVKGDFSTTAANPTINFTKALGGYFHYGKMTQTQNAPAILVNDPLNGYNTYGNTGPKIYIRNLVGPAGQTGVYAGLTSSAGIRSLNSTQWNYEIGVISGFYYGVLVDQSVVDGPSGRAVSNDNWFQIQTIIFCAYGVRFLGPPAIVGSGLVQCQGNRWFIQLVYTGAVAGTIAGIVKDANLIHQYQQYIGGSFVVGGAIPDYTSNAGNTGGTRALSGDWGRFLYAKNVTVQNDDFMIIQNPASDGAGNNPLNQRFNRGPTIMGSADNRSGLTAADGAATTLFTVQAITGLLFRVTVDIFATAFTSGTATYTLTWTENGVSKTLVVTATALNVLATATNLINPDSGTAITVQLTGVFSATVKVAGVVEQIA